MAKIQVPLIIDTKNVHINQVFSSLTALFREVANKPLSTGTTRTNQLKQLSRHLKYQKLCEVNPDCKKKNSVIVTEIHNPPLRNDDDGRGKHGTYVDLAKPLLLETSMFQGKYTTLSNQIGLFSEYFEEVRALNPEISKQLRTQESEWDYNLWQQRDSMALGERAYRSTIGRKAKEILKTSLESLQNEGIITLRSLYVIVPDKMILMEDCTTRERSGIEAEYDWKNYQRAIQQEANCENALINPELAEHLILGLDYKYPQMLLAGIEENTSIDCTPEQESAVENYQLYVRQCAVKEYLHLDKLPRQEEQGLIGNIGLFFQNQRLF